MQPFSFLGVFTNGLMPDKVLDLLLHTVGRGGSIGSARFNFPFFCNWQTSENISEKNHARCREVAETILSKNGMGLMFSLNLYSIEQDLQTQCWEIDEIYQDMGYA